MLLLLVGDEMREVVGPVRSAEKADTD
jgi:hypothetical protein